MGRLLSLVRGVECSIRSRLGAWMQEVSLAGDQIPGMQADITQLQVDVTGQISAYMTQVNWYVNAATGNDANDGETALTAIQTQSELTRRFEGRTISPSVPTVTVNLAGTFTQPLSLHCSGVPGTTINVIGETPTQNATGSLTAAFVPFAPATNVDAKVTDGAQVWAPLIGKRIRMTSGTSSGAITWLAKDLGANVVRVGQFIERSTGKMKSPTNGDTYAVETLVTLVPGLDVVISGGAAFYAKDVNFALSQDSVRIFAGALPANLWIPAHCILDGCQIASAPFQCKVEQSAVAMIACRSAVSTRFYHSDITLFGHVAVAEVASQIGNRIAVMATCLGQGANAGIKAYDDAEVALFFDATFTAASYGVYDNTSGFSCEIAGTALFHAGNFAATYLFGSGNTGTAAVTVRSGNQFVYVSKPVITGPTNDVKIGGTVKSWAQVPFVEPANNAMIAVFT